MTEGVRLEAGRGLWRCDGCGYCNVDTPACDMCNTAAPLQPVGIAAPTYQSEWRDLYEQTNPRPDLRPPDLFVEDDAPSAKAGRAAMRTVAGVIVANIVVQLFTLAVARSRHLDVSKAVSLSLITGLMFYSAVAVWVAFRGDYLRVQARWVIGSGSRAALIGLVTGGCGAGLLTVLVSQARGHTTVDPIAAVLSDQKAGALVLGAIVIAVLAPIVEELVFRGFLAEAFRSKGKGPALLVSAVAFSIAHLRFAQFQYYVAMGVAFGLLYWKRGLVASVCTHAAFNGGLLAIAIAVSHGPASTVAVDGFTMRLPADWHRANAAAAVDWGALGPGGAEVAFSHRTLPAPLEPARFAAALRSGRLAAPNNATYDPQSVQTVRLSVGTAVEMHATVNGRTETAVFIINGTSYVAIDFFANGTSRAQREFDTMVQSLLPAAPTASSAG